MPALQPLDSPVPETPAAGRRIGRHLLAWYDRHRRRLPWRAEPGATPDPYRVWLSEIMLQQTTVATVGPYFETFLARWPTVEALAAAPLDDILHAWQGLGYYARARNLHACARAVAERFGGRFPADEMALRNLPGVGPYTAAAVAAIAFDRPTTPVDGNVERVVARLFTVTAPLPGAKKELGRLARALTPTDRPGDHAQAMMDLGATVCTPRAPACPRCPLEADCAARRAGTPADFPRRAPRPERPTRYGVAFVAIDPAGAVLFRRRPDGGLLGGLMEVPTTDFRPRPWRDDEAAAVAPFAARWRRLPGPVRHGFTHFRLELSILVGRLDRRPADSLWRRPEAFGEMALSSLMKKAVARALADPAGPGNATGAARAPGDRPE
jgi:A/G-specific adenine glycosylase